MILITVMYPAGAKTKFDLDYYLGKHIPLLKERWTSHGLHQVQVVKGVGKPDGSAPDYQMAALLTFGSLDDFKAAGQGPWPRDIRRHREFHRHSGDGSNQRDSGLSL